MKLVYTKLVYFDTLYNRNSEFRVTGQITFNERNEAVFAACGMKYAIPVNRIVSIETIEEDF
jgi:hypothetical protein